MSNATTPTSAGTSSDSLVGYVLVPFFFITVVGIVVVVMMYIQKKRRQGRCLHPLSSSGNLSPRDCPTSSVGRVTLLSASVFGPWRSCGFPEQPRSPLSLPVSGLTGYVTTCYRCTATTPQRTCMRLNRSCWGIQTTPR
ncbi:small integral membrane protein 29 isoform X1 [Dermochelys coriacea]|uniref:small integral membrane protein 29 isoform X1 n=1 Tax=Dermochelys coriacea TaxID=27794 RepID=UPI001CA94272|nr:small integral membrane protein 29 isoform X1 [Dermochelys coriacea]